MQKKKTINITFKNKDSETVILQCEIAKTLSQKMKGLMHRETLPKEQGMFFPFLIPWIRFFWMKNVKIPLDIIFINRHRKIIAVYEAPVETGFLLKNYWSKGFCKYVVECNIGFCKKHNISKGRIIEIKKED
jgi:hypothetical protein